jgi:hypothetical protein
MTGKCTKGMKGEDYISVFIPSSACFAAAAVSRWHHVAEQRVPEKRLLYLTHRCHAATTQLASARGGARLSGANELLTSPGS